MGRDNLFVRGAAAAAVARIRADQARFSERLHPLFDTLAARFTAIDFDVNALCRESGFERTQASSWFASEVGKTLKSYLTDCRLRVAADLLAHTTFQVYRVARLSGYVNVKTFSGAFKTWSGGRTPGQYRANPDPGRPLRSPVADPARVEAAFAGRPSVGELRELYEETEQLSQALRGLCPEPFSEVLAAADHALGAADYNTALTHLTRAERHSERGLFAPTEIRVRFAVAWHGCGAAHTLDGDVDRAFIDLANARETYATAGELPLKLRRRRCHLERIGVSCETTGVLYDALCSACRDELKNDAGRSLCEHLRRALEAVPRGLEWFHTACDECYRVVWRAISAARLGLLADAFQAAWLCETAKPHLRDPQAPPSRGRFIAALAQVEASLHGDQNERLKFCDLALADAEQLGDFRLVAEARTWRANVLRAKGELSEARAELATAKEVCQASPWLAALHRRMEGLMEDSATNFRAALRLARDAAGFYESLDSHLVGVLRVHEANALFFLGEYETAIEHDLNALGFLDHRRDPITAHGAVPIHLAISFGSLGRLERAELALSQCQYDRKAYPGLMASEAFTRACLRLEQGRAPEALRCFVEAREGFEELHRARPAALVTSYSVEASARLGDRAGALENAATALRFFEAAGCARDTLEALGKLRTLLESDQVDVKAVSVLVRRLCRENGGWLPEPQ